MGRISCAFCWLSAYLFAMVHFLAQGCLLPKGFRVAVGLLGALALMLHLLIFVPSFPSFTAPSLFLPASPLLLSFSHFFLSFLGAVDEHKNTVTRGLR